MGLGIKAKKEKEKAAASSVAPVGPDEQPPPYEDTRPGPSAPPALHLRHPPPPQPQPRYWFPEEWCLFSGGALDTTLVLGASPDAPLYAVSTHVGWSGQPDVVLHCGPNTNMPALASAQKDFTFGNNGPNAIVVPALNPHDFDNANNSNGGGMAVVTEPLVPVSGWTAAMHFSIEVGAPNSPPAREAFEWRHSRGDAVVMLDEAGYGYKLVRLSPGPPPGVPPSAQFVGGGFMSSQGEEVVAVFARAAASFSRRMRFRYLGTGASGLLGDRWALMAAVTAIRLWQRDQRARR